MRIDNAGDVRFAANATGAALIKGVSGNQTDRNTGGYPQFTFVGNEGTGMRRPLTNVLAFDTGGAERVRITSAGDVNIGGTSSGGVPKVNFFHNDSLRAFIQATSAAGMLLDSDGKMTFNTNNAAKWHIQSSGHLTPNNQHSFDIGGVNAEVRNIYAQQLLIGKSASNVAAAGLYVAPNLSLIHI